MGGLIPLKVKDADSLGVKDLGLVNQPFDGGENGRYGKDHFSDFLIQPKRELADKVKLVLGSSFHG